MNAAQQTAISNADAYTQYAALPTWSELALSLRQTSDMLAVMGAAMNQRGIRLSDKEPNNLRKRFADALISAGRHLQKVPK